MNNNNKVYVKLQSSKSAFRVASLQETGTGWNKEGQAVRVYKSHSSTKNNQYCLWPIFIKTIHTEVP